MDLDVAGLLSRCAAVIASSLSQNSSDEVNNGQWSYISSFPQRQQREAMRYQVVAHSPFNKGKRLRDVGATLVLTSSGKVRLTY
jgi:hypothetical protein